MGKYEPLGLFLKKQNSELIPMTFSEIERILKRPLPASKSHRAWWSNNPTNNVMTQQWLDAGFESESVDVVGEKLVFRRKAKRLPRNGERAPIFGCMKGMATIAPGYDLTEPTGEDWLVGSIGGLDRLREKP